MSDYIKREDALDAWYDNERFTDIEAIPATDVVERKRGKWIYQFHEDEVGVTCSECEGYAESFARWIYDEGYRIDYNFCPNCGAEMESADDV